VTVIVTVIVIVTATEYEKRMIVYEGTVTVTVTE